MTIVARTIEYRGNLRRYLRMRLDRLRLINRRVRLRGAHELYTDKDTREYDGHPLKYFSHTTLSFSLSSAVVYFNIFSARPLRSLR